MTRAAVVVALAHLALGCAGDEAPQAPAPERCRTTPPVRSKSADAALALGQGDELTFTPYEDGQVVTLIHGPQGGFMITPVLQADRADMDTDGRCVTVHLSATFTDQAPIELDVTLPDVTVDASHLTTEPLPFLLSFDPGSLDGRACSVSAALEDDGVTASGEVAIVLARP